MHRALAATLTASIAATTDTSGTTARRETAASGLIPKVQRPTTYTLANPTQPVLSTSNTTTSGARAEREDRLFQRGLHALVSLSTTAGRADKSTSSLFAFTDRHNNDYNSFDNDVSDNPFLERPPRKLFKYTHDGTVSPTARHSSIDVTSKVDLRQRPRAPTHASATRSNGLLLTRVLPSNRTQRSGDQRAMGKSPSLLSPTTPSSSAVSGTMSKNSVSTKDIEGFPIPISRSSTTPMQPPKIDYYRFLDRGNTNINSSADEGSDAGRGPNQINPQRKSFMEYARKSLMQHATASPQTAIRKINKVAAESNGKPTITDLLLASDAEDNMDSRPPAQQPTRESMHKSFAKSDTPFTFESPFLPPFNSTATTTVIPAGSNTFTSSVLNFSRPSRIQRSDSFSSVQAGSRDEAAKAGHDSGGEASAMPGHIYSGNTGHERLYSRAEPHEDFSQIHHEPPHLESASGLKASIVRRVAPYKVPTVNERETLRSSRMPGFRARPLDPKVFTSAGDLGVPRIRKLPLTVPVSPDFSKPREKDPSKRTQPVRTAIATRFENTIKAKLANLPAFNADVTEAGRAQTEINRPGAGRVTGNDSTATARKTLLSVPSVDQIRPQPGDTVVANINYQTNRQPAPTETTTSIYPGNLASRVAQESRFKVLLGKPIKTAMQKSIRGAPMREEDPNPASTIDQSSDEQAAPPVTLDRSRDIFLQRPLTKFQPFSFATDELLRRRHAMFQPRSASVWETAAEGTRTTAKTSVVKRSQPPLKRLTVPVPFQLATQQRAEIYAQVHQNHYGGNSGAQLASSSKGTRRRSRLAGLAPLRSILPHGTTSDRNRKYHFKPTVPISPKLGRHVPVRALQPARFLLKKSTKELTQPHEFHFHLDDRTKERELLEQSAKRRGQELEEARQRTTRLHLERDHRRRIRESMERTFHAQPIKHYPPITIRKATKLLTNPVSPMIGEKRKRHEMEMQSITQQKQQQGPWEHPLQHENQLDEPSAGNQNGSFMADLNPVVGQHVYREFEEAKILQEQHQTLQEQLTRQERRQIELANSSRATIHQPPIRISFPLNPEVEALQADDTELELSRSGGTHEDNSQPNFTPALPTVRDSFEGSENRHLSKELRRTSLSDRRTSGGHRRRTADVGNQSHGSGSGRSSLEGRRSDMDNNTGGYYPFTRSQVPTDAALNQSIVAQGSAASLFPMGARSAATPIAAGSAAGEDRRRSGSFIPLGTDEPPRKPLSRSKGAVVIDHTLTLDDL